jgi:radical SAM superfamily enzyme with C-terminal helix-hairpin-helix motif
VNIRQVMTFAGTPMQGYEELAAKHKGLFLRYKEKMRNEIDMPMLRRVAPVGTVLKGVHTEIFDKITFGRQLGTYPLLVGIPAQVEINSIYDVMVTDHGYRSITGIPVPFDINRAPLKLLEQIPGVGRKQAGKIVMGRPYKDKEDAVRRAGIRRELLDYIAFCQKYLPECTHSVKNIYQNAYLLSSR